MPSNSKKTIEFLTENDLSSAIKGKNLSGCYCIFGEEQYLIKRHINEMLQLAVTDLAELNLMKFDGAVKAQTVYDAVTAFPVMSASRAVTLCDFPFDKASQSEIDKLFSAIADMPPTTVFIIWFETVQISQKKPGDRFLKLFSAVTESGGHVYCIGRKNTADIMRLLQSGAARRKCRMEPTTARYMIDTCSDDLSTLINELEKLCFYVGEGGNISNETVDTVCSRSLEASVYNISRAVLKGDVAGAYKILDDLSFMNTDPAYILTILASSYIDIYRAYAAKCAGIRPEAAAKELGYFGTAFRMTDAERQLKNLSEKQITESLRCLCECDMAVKGSRVPGRTTLEKAVVQLALIARGRT